MQRGAAAGPVFKIDDDDLSRGNYSRSPFRPTDRPTDRATATSCVVLMVTLGSTFLAGPRAERASGASAAAADVRFSPLSTRGRGNPIRPFFRKRPSFLPSRVIEAKFAPNRMQILPLPTDRSERTQRSRSVGQLLPGMFDRPDYSIPPHPIPLPANQAFYREGRVERRRASGHKSRLESNPGLKRRRCAPLFTISPLAAQPSQKKPVIHALGSEERRSSSS